MVFLSVFLLTTATSSPFMDALTGPDGLLTRALEYTDNFRYVPQNSPMAYWPIPIGTSFFYLAMVFTLRHLMKDREAMKLRVFMIIHNFIMTVVSTVVFLGISISLVRLAIKHNFDRWIFFCDSDQIEVNQGTLYFFIYVFYLSKYYELIDTVFILLRKGRLMFLHAYHHWATLVLIYVCLEVGLPVQWSAEGLNALVHIPMYYYYLQTLFGREVWWKRYLTLMQITQFVIVDTLHLTSFYHHYVLGGKCSSFDTWGNQFGFAIITSYMVLFVWMYIDTYSKNKAAKTKAALEKAKEKKQ